MRNNQYIKILLIINAHVKITLWWFVEKSTLCVAQTWMPTIIMWRWGMTRKRAPIWGITTLLFWEGLCPIAKHAILSKESLQSTFRVNHLSYLDFHIDLHFQLVLGLVMPWLFLLFYFALIFVSAILLGFQFSELFLLFLFLVSVL